MAFGISCLEIACQSLNLNSPEIDSLIQHLWSFTASVELDQWEEVLLEGVGGYFLDLYDQQQKLSQFSELYPPIIIELVHDTIEIGRANLYGGTGKYSELTFRYTEKVMKIMQSLYLEMPTISNFSAL
jgi:hypothetical protein